MYDRVKIFGERNTATNALRRLIERNARVSVVPSVLKHVSEHLGLDPGDLCALSAREREARIDRFFRDVDPVFAWKHRSLAALDPDIFLGCLIVLTCRHPASWLLALHRKPYAALAEVPDGFAPFLRMRWEPVGRDAIGDEALTPIALYNRKLRGMLVFLERLAASRRDVVVVRFEDFVLDQVGVLARAKPFLRDPTDRFKPIETSTKDPAKSRAFYAAYYGEARWLDEIDDEAAALIEAEVDWQAAGAVGYDTLAVMRAARPRA